MVTKEEYTEIGYLIADERKTIRQVAQIMGRSRSGIHQIIHTSLKNQSQDLYRRVCTVLEYHKSIRHLRGGESIRIQYLRRKRDTANG